MTEKELAEKIVKNLKSEDVQFPSLLILRKAQEELHKRTLIDF